MFILLFIAIQFILISLYDIWQMAKAEIVYWEDINAALPNLTPEQQVAIQQQKTAGSNATSLGQFVFWYSEILLSILGFWGTTPLALIILGLIMFLHYSGLEDWLYFVFASFIEIPESWWAYHSSIKILFWKFPTELPWLAETKLGFIPSYWMPLWGGPTVKAKGLTWCVFVSLAIVVSLIIWII